MRILTNYLFAHKQAVRLTELIVWVICILYAIWFIYILLITSIIENHTISINGALYVRVQQLDA